MSSISVKNFGPIAHASVELKPLTVLIGPNNTGKSYFALATYSLARAIADFIRPYMLRFSSRLFRDARSDRLFNRRFKSAIDASGYQLPPVEKIQSEGMGFNEFPPEIQQWMRNESKPLAPFLSSIISHELRRCFGSGLDQLGRKVTEAENLQFSVSLRDESTGLCWEFQCQDDSLVTGRWEPDLPRSSQPIKFPRRLTSVAFNDQGDISLGHLLIMAYANFLLSIYPSQSHYLPAGRTGILQAHKTLASLLVGRASRAWIDPIEVERLPGVITDLIRALLLLRDDRPQSKKASRITQYLEGYIVNGSVDLERQLEYPDITYTTQAGAFQLHQVSSTVSEIAPLVLLLKYLVRPGELFVIEEPESHLDPANQMRLARAIAMMVNADIRVLVTTHSDIFLNQINNLMQASGLPSRRRLRMGYYATEVLDSDKVAAYMFHPGSNGTEVTALPIEPGSGISTESFDAVHQVLYDESIRMEHMG